MSGTATKYSRKMARYRQIPRARSRRSEHRITKQRRRRLQLNNERCVVGTLKNSIQSISPGDPGGHVYLRFVNKDQYSLQDSEGSNVRWDNVILKKGFDAQDIDKLAEEVVGKILRQLERQYYVGEI
ncbi:uncharacterized protein BKA55DRAFT_196385 [Fusarium redolens]|uniref:Uncharacterized protein n=1 Tax=Fusarium redolens TaxID=48865 RepID=A0A9P9G4E2_FUSRE|nr:uncharacterized protein BKA55DRAFT_196385 [Fusarium redolens]KAH7231219.1 hypothetical protein BKA55DRAFT_196385 [Fusarium redolens]